MAYFVSGMFIKHFLTSIQRNCIFFPPQNAYAYSKCFFFAYSYPFWRSFIPELLMCLKHAVKNCDLSKFKLDSKGINMVFTTTNLNISEANIPVGIIQFNDLSKYTVASLLMGIAYRWSPNGHMDSAWRREGPGRPNCRLLIFKGRL